MLFSGPDLKLLSSGQQSSLTQSLQLGKEIATLANTALPLMKKHGIALKFSQATESGLVIADATCNLTAAYGH